MAALHGGDAFGAGQQTHKLDGLRVQLFDPLDCCDGRVAGGEHGVNHNHVALIHVVRHLEVVLDSRQRFRVAVQADVAYARAGHNTEHAFQNAVAGAQYGHKHQLLAVYDLGLHLLQRGFDFNALHRHVACDLVGQQHADLMEQGAKGVGRCVLAAHQRQLVLHQRVGYEVDFVFVVGEGHLVIFLLEEVIFDWVCGNGHTLAVIPDLIRDPSAYLNPNAGVDCGSSPQ